MARNPQPWLANYLATGSLMVLASVVPPLSVPSVMARSLASDMGSSSMGASGMAARSVQVSQVLSWGELIKLLKPRRKSGGGRNPSFCFVAMSDDPRLTNRVASNNPTIYWQKNAHTIGIRVSLEDAPFWKKQVSRTSPGIRQVRYDGAPLKADVEYEVVAYSSTGTVLSTANFQVLSAPEQKDLQTQLKTLSGKDEATLFKRLSLYENKKLSTDALGELLMMKNTSREAQQALQSLPEIWCPKPEQNPLEQEPAQQKPAKPAEQSKSLNPSNQS